MAAFLPRSGRISSVLFWGCALAVLAAAAEILARRITGHANLAAAFERGPYRRILIFDPPGGSPGPARVTTNRWGMRGEDPPFAWEAWDTWLALGSSTTLCPYQDDALTWPARLQARLRAAHPRTWVGNAGADGLTTASLPAMLERVAAPIRPKAVLILPGGPDLARDLSDEGRGPNPFDAACMRRLERMEDRPPLRRRLGLLRLIRRDDSRFIPDSSGHHPWDPPPLSAPEDALPASDSLLPSLPAYRAELRRLGAIARSLGLRAVFLTHPIAYGTDSAWTRREARSVVLYGRALRISCAQERRLRDEFNRALLDVCATDALECFDLAGSMSGHPEWFYDGSHFNDAGSDRAAELIARYLMK